MNFPHSKFEIRNPTFDIQHLMFSNFLLYLRHHLPNKPLMTRKLFPITCCLLFSHVVNGQQLPVTPPPAQTTIVARAAGDTSNFSKVEIEAEFPGGGVEWTNFLRKNLNARVPVKKKAPAGTYQVIVRFIVSKDGSVSDAMAETSHGYGMEEEVLRIIKKSPKWVPASQDGRPVNAYRRQPITFSVTGK